MTHLLDRPVWSSLTTRQAPLALGSGPALRIAPDYGPFAATADLTSESLAALHSLPIDETGLYLVEAQAVAAPSGMASTSALCAQMVAQDVRRLEPGFEVLELSDADAPEMLALAALTRPGPFSTATHRLGRFIGAREEGRLVAMAGERMQPDGFTELSGVCSHPDHRGKGYAAVLSSIVTGRILDRGETPFLHTYAANARAIALYEWLGFTLRRHVTLTVLKRA